MIQSSKRQVKRGANIILKVVKVVKDELTAFAFNCVFYWWKFQTIIPNDS